ncbi:MAG: radical SAM protein [Calditrichia bacterium]
MLKYSKYTHVLEKDGTFAYYNSLRLTPVFVDKDSRELLDRFKSGAEPKEFLSGISDSGDRAFFRRILQAFLDQKILIENSAEDERELNFHLSKISRPYIHLAYFLLTDNCNFACKYCFVREPMPDNQKSIRMTTETALKGLDIYARLIHTDEKLLEQEKAIIFYGGEPLMNFPVLAFTIEKIAEYKGLGKLPAHLKTLMVTNGSLMTEERARFLKKHDVTVTFSLDGTAAHNAHRILRNGKPAYPQIVRGLRICQKFGLDINIACTLTPRNLAQPGETIKSFAEDYGVKRLGFNMLLDNNIMPVPEDYNKKASEFIIEAHKVFRKKGIRENRINRKLNSFERRQVYLYDCMAAGGRQMAIHPEGKIGICHEHLWDRQHFISDVDDPDFDPAGNEIYLEWSKRTPLNMEKCRDCIALGICGGGCLVNAEHRGSIWQTDERLCEQSKTLLEWMIWESRQENIRQQPA